MTITQKQIISIKLHFFICKYLKISSLPKITRMEVYVLVSGLTLFALGFAMIFGQPSFLISRYEVFQNFVRRREITVNRDGLSKFYSFLFFILGTPLLIGAIIGLINPETFMIFSVWLVIAIAGIGVVGILYCNISNRFIRE